MICKYFNPVLLIIAVTISQVFCDTRELYQPQPPQNLREIPTGSAIDNYYEPRPSNTGALATPRTFLWYPFEFLTLESLIPPAFTFLGVIVGLCGFFQLSNWFLELVSQINQSKKTETEGKKTLEVEETNEIEARRKRMLAAEVSYELLIMFISILIYQLSGL